MALQNGQSGGFLCTSHKLIEQSTHSLWLHPLTATCSGASKHIPQSPPQSSSNPAILAALEIMLGCLLTIRELGCLPTMLRLRLQGVTSLLISNQLVTNQLISNWLLQMQVFVVCSAEAPMRLSPSHACLLLQFPKGKATDTKPKT